MGRLQMPLSPIKIIQIVTDIKSLDYFQTDRSQYYLLVSKLLLFSSSKFQPILLEEIHAATANVPQEAYESKEHFFREAASSPASLLGKLAVQPGT